MVFLWDLNKTKAVGFARLAQGQENIVSMAVSPEEDKAVCFTSCSRVFVVKLCNLECALSSSLAQMKCKVTTAKTSQQLAGEITSTSTSPSPSAEDENFSSSDSEEDMHDYYLEHDDVDEFD